MHQAILDALPAQIALVDAEGCIVTVNRAWRDFAGANGLRSAEHCVGHNYLVTCAAAEGDGAADARAAADGLRAVLCGEQEEFVLEYPCHSPEEQRWFRLLISPVQEAVHRGAVLMHENITERKLAELALRQSEETLRLTIAAANDSLWHWDLATGEMFWSDRGYEMLGLSREQLRPTIPALLEYTHPEDREPFQNAIRRCLESSAPQHVAVRWRRGDGSYGHFLVRGVALRSATGEPLRLIGATTDVTPFLEAQSRLQHAHRLESLGTLATGLAHDLNNALHPITMVLGVFRARLTDANSRNMLDLVAANAERASALVELMLSFARGVEGARQPVFAAQLVGAVIRQLGAALPRTIVIRQRISEGIWPILGDAAQLEQALLKVCDNAREAMPGGGLLDLAVDNIAPGADGSATSPPDVHLTRHVRITVTDSGAGVPASIRERVFDPFFTTKNPGDGSSPGLGLTTALAILRGHGGSIELHSREGSGASVRLLIPAAEESRATG